MKREITILLVEDNEGDIVLTVEALREAKITNKVVVVRDGEEALNYLYREGKYHDVESPDIIFLDINLPRVDGKEVLIKIKADETLRSIPVVILTTSDNEKDITESYDNHANCYITKPVDFNKFMRVISMINDFWITIVKLPLHD
jgi:two-component system, chemotaxis family, response regulator Rcp1